MTTTWGAVFGDGWNGSLINPLTRAEAEARDSAGAPYAAVLVDEHGAVRAEVRVAWASSYLAVACYDGRGRTRAILEFRPTGDGDLALWTERTSDGPESMTDEEFARTAARESTTWQRGNGLRTHTAAPKGDIGGSSSGVDHAPAPRFARPAFGQWSELLERAGTGWVELTDAGTDTDRRPGTTVGEAPWRVPRPLTPRDLAGLFTDGAERMVGVVDPRHDEPRAARIEVVPAGRLRVPSGRLVAADPGEIGDGEEKAPFLVTVPPGVYPMSISRAHLGDDHTRVAAVRLEVGTGPVASWELALRPGEDPLDLGEGAFFGVDVDSGCACLVDAALWDGIGDADDAYALTVDIEEFTLFRDGGLLAYLAGWGDGTYPTWIGRDAAGAVVCFVTDMLL